MVKTYLRYVHEEAFGLVASPKAPTVTDPSGKFAFAPGIHEVLVWDLRRGELARFMTPDGEGYLKGEVTSILVVGGSGSSLAVGYSTGMVRCYDAAKGGKPTVSLMGHKGAVTCLGGDGHHLLCSGGNDTDLVIWDLVAERGLCRLNGHRDAITSVRFVPRGRGGAGPAGAAMDRRRAPQALTVTGSGGATSGGGPAAVTGGFSCLLVSASKDALVKVWDLDTQSCVQTVVGHRAEVWSLAVSPDGGRLVSGSNDERLRVWDLTAPVAAGSGGAADEAASLSSSSSSGMGGSVARFMGSVNRTTASDRCAGLHYHVHHDYSARGGSGGAGEASSGGGSSLAELLLGVQSSGKLVDVFRCRAPEEAKKKLKRRLKRFRDKVALRTAKDGASSGASGAKKGGSALASLDAAEDFEAADKEAMGPGGAACPTVIASDELDLCGTLRAPAKLVSFAFLPSPRSAQRGGKRGGGGGGKGEDAGGGDDDGDRGGGDSSSVRLLLSLATNSLEVHEIFIARQKSGDHDAKAAAPQAPQKLLRLELPGHRTDPKALAFSNDSTLLASVASGSLKVWSAATRTCIRSLDDLESAYVAGAGRGEAGDRRVALAARPKGKASGGGGGGGGEGAGGAVTAMCLCWLPGDRYLVVGTKEGALLVCDLATGSVSDRLGDAHTGCVWSLDLSPDGLTVASGSADQEVKLWDVEEVDGASGAGAGGGGGGEFSDEDDEEDNEEDNEEDEEDDEEGGGDEDEGEGGESKKSKKAKKVEGGGGVRTTLSHAKTLKMGDDVTCVRFSRSRDPAKVLLCVATLDATVRVFFKDTLKFFLQLYGHKLPVLCMDVSDDSTLIATAGADKTLKLWGLDFGDCHRSLLAHSDAVTGCRFLPRTHYVFTSSKDKKVKYWDADHFEKVLELDGHASEVWGLTVSGDGASVATCGKDRSVRLWCRTDEPVFLEEERERELEEATAGNAADLGKAYELNSGFGGAAPAAPPMGGDDDEFGVGDDTGAAGSGAGGGGGGVHAYDNGSGASGRATKGTLESLKGGERLMECLAVAHAEDKAHAAWLGQRRSALALGKPAPAPRPANPLMLGAPDGDRLLLKTLRHVKVPDLEEALLVLPFHLVEDLVGRLGRLLAQHLDPELCGRAAAFVVRLHHAPLSASGRSGPLLLALRDASASAVRAATLQCGTNLAGLKLLKRAMEGDRQVIDLPDHPVAAKKPKAKAADSAVGARNKAKSNAAADKKKKQKQQKVKKGGVHA